MPSPRPAVRRADDRSRTTADGLEVRHSFSAGSHYDPANTSYGVLVACDDIRLSPGAGFPLHRHRDLEVVTWVLAGELAHEDAAGATATLRPGTVQVISAGAGVVHAERATDRRTRVVQSWLVPDDLGTTPAHAIAERGDRLSDGDLVAVASGSRHHQAAGALPLGCAGATLHVARLSAGRAVRLPTAPDVHVLVACGSVELAGTGRLADGDAVRLAGGRQSVTADAGAEVLVWEMHATLQAPLRE